MLNISSYGNDLNITKSQAAIGSHPGECDKDIAYLRTIPTIKRQLAKINPDNLRKELKEYGAWSNEELLDHDANLSRWLWISCGSILEEIT